MTRSAQHPPASPGAESGSDGEKTAAAAAVAATTSGPRAEAPAETGRQPRPAAGPTEAKSSEAGSGTKPSGAEETPAPDAAATAPGTDAGTGPATAAAPGGRTGAAAENEADPGAAAAAKSRLPALVRTMTATAIDRPQPRTGPVGRPGKAVLSGAAVAGALLVSVPFLLLGGNDDKGPRTSSAAAGTVLGGDGQETPGDFAVTEPSTGPSDDDGKKTEKSEKPEEPVRKAPASPPAEEKDKDEDEPKKDTGKENAGKKDEPDRKSGGAADGGDKDQPAQPSTGVTFSAPASLRSHLSGRCLDVPDGNFNDGQALWVWDCNNSQAQQWRFASDGTIRIKDKCLDVANANFNDGTTIQIAWCNGNIAQQFVLNERHDLVNTVVGKCVDVAEGDRGNGVRLQLWTCNGTDAQKWSV